MRSIKYLVGWGGILTVFLVGPVWADSFSLNTLIDEGMPSGGLTYVGSNQIVAGNNGTVATISSFDEESSPVITLNLRDQSTQYVVHGDAQSFIHISELALSQNESNELTFIADAGTDPSPQFGLYQYSFTNSGGSLATLDNGTAHDLKTTGSTDIESLHYQVNSSGTAVYKYIDQTNGNAQTFATTGANPRVVAEGDDHGLHDFNNPPPATTNFKQQVIAGNGSVVFLAADLNTNSTYSIYRLDANNTLTQAVTANVDANTQVIGASNNAVLYTLRQDSATVSLNLSGVGALTTYTDNMSGPVASNAEMTQQNRVAFFTPGSAAGDASVEYYDSVHGVTPIATESSARPGVHTVSDGSNTYTIKQISTDQFLGTAPMVNDHGTVVFDAVLTPTADPSDDVNALLLWQASTGQTQIIARADQNSDNSDEYTYSSEDKDGHKIIALQLNNSIDKGSDVLKDGLSDDNWLAFGIAYLDGEDIRSAVVSVFIPEPASVGMLAVAGAGVLIRRRRRTARSLD